MNKANTVILFLLSFLLMSTLLFGYEIEAEDHANKNCIYCECIHPRTPLCLYKSYCRCTKNRCIKKQLGQSTEDWVYSPDGLFRASCNHSRSRDSFVMVEKVGTKRKVFKFNSVISFSFSTDSNYIFIERSEYNDELYMTNNFIEVFDLHNRKRLFYMPFVRKFYTSRKSRLRGFNLSERINLKLKGETLKSVEWYVEDVPVQVPAHLQQVRSVYASEYSLGISVFFKDGLLKIYLPNKDFTHLYETFEFMTPQVIGRPVTVYLDDPVFSPYEYCLEDDQEEGAVE